MEGVEGELLLSALGLLLGMGTGPGLSLLPIACAEATPPPGVCVVLSVAGLACVEAAMAIATSARPRPTRGMPMEVAAREPAAEQEEA